VVISPDRAMFGDLRGAGAKIKILLPRSSLTMYP